MAWAPHPRWLARAGAGRRALGDGALLGCDGARNLRMYVPCCYHDDREPRGGGYALEEQGADGGAARMAAAPSRALLQSNWEGRRSHMVGLAASRHGGVLAVLERFNESEQV